MVLWTSEYTKWQPDSVNDIKFPTLLQEEPHLYEKGLCFPADKEVHS